MKEGDLEVLLARLSVIKSDHAKGVVTTNGTAAFNFIVSVKGRLTSVQADQVILLGENDNEGVKFIVHNNTKDIVAAFKDYDYFFLEGIV